MKNPIDTDKVANRLAVYKRALKLVRTLPLEKQQLCFMLQFIRNDRNFTGTGDMSEYLRSISHHTMAGVYFPEFSKYYRPSMRPLVVPSEITYRKLFETDTTAWRIRVLNKCIKECSLEIKNTKTT